MPKGFFASVILQDKKIAAARHGAAAGLSVR
jgi:hypothetical protein